MINYWHHVVCLSVRLWHCALWVNDTSYSKSVWTVEYEVPQEHNFTTFSPLQWPILSKSPLLKHWCWYCLVNILKPYSFLPSFLSVITMTILSPCSSVFAAGYGIFKWYIDVFNSLFCLSSLYALSSNMAIKSSISILDMCPNHDSLLLCISSITVTENHITSKQKLSKFPCLK